MRRAVIFLTTASLGFVAAAIVAFWPAAAQTPPGAGYAHFT